MMDTIFIPFETHRLAFRQHVSGDAEAFCAMEMDADVRRYVGGYPRTKEEAEKRFSGNLQPVTNGLGLWAIVLKTEDKYIGRGGIYPHTDGNNKPISGKASLSLYIAKEYWGNGYATEAGQAFVQFGFQELKLDRIVAMIDAGNNASIKIMEKLGLKLVDTGIGQWRTFHHFKIEKEEFKLLMKQ